MIRLMRALTVVLALAIAAPSFSVDTDGAASKVSTPPVALITGSDRGLGFALTQELTARGWRVIATCRSPEKAAELRAFAAANPGVVIERLDVADDAAIDALAAKLRGQPIDALINNAGVIGRVGTPRVEDLDPAELQRVMRVNTYAPMRLARTFMPNIEASRHKKIVSLSSGLGSLTRVPDFAQNAPGYDYAVSKAGLNISMRMLAYEVRSRGVIVGLISPGAIDTAMQAQVRAASAAEGKPITAPMVTPAESARGVVDVMMALTAEKSGRFFSHTGAEIPW
jgi:NAD(P)-dependent dehydrogenase (short-subunit alcohol dehydrogenase family)